MKAKQNILFGILLFCILMLIYFLWKPWGPIVVWGLGGISFLRGATVFWQRQMIYVSISYAIWAIVSLVLFVQLLLIPNASWGWIAILVVFGMPIMIEIERRKNPDKMKKWELARKNVSFFKLLWFHLPDLEDKEKPENKEG